MTRIDGLGNNNFHYFETKPEKTEQTEATSTELQNSKLTQKSADDVLNFLGNSANSINISTKSRIIDVSKYVTPDEAKRIAGFVGQYETGIENTLQTLNIEFGSLTAYQNMSNSAKLSLATTAFADVNL